MKIASFFALALPLFCFGQMDKVQIKENRLSSTVYYLEGRGGNIGVYIRKDDVILIDDQFAPLTEKIVAKVGEITTKPIKYVINTHYHGDHTGGNANLKRTGIEIAAHKNVKDRLSTTFTDPIRNRTVKAVPDDYWPTIDLTEQKKLFKKDFTIIHTPNAHTDGDIMIFFKKENIIHTGDAFVRYGFPFIDVAGGGTIDGIIAAQEQILRVANAQTRIIPGHGKVASIADVQELLTMLTETRAIIKKEKRKGTLLEDLIPQNPLADYHKRWTGSFINTDLYVQLVYESL